MIQKTKNSIKATGDDANDIVAAMKAAYVPKPNSCLESAMASRTVYPESISRPQENDKTAAEHLIETVQMIAQYLRGMNQDGTAAVLETAIEKYRAEAPGRCITCGNEVSGNIHFCTGKK